MSSRSCERMELHGRIRSSWRAGAQGGCGSLGLLPDAQPRASDPEPTASRWARPCRGRSTSPLHQFHQCTGPLDGASVSEPFRVGCHGRIASAFGVCYVSLNPVRARLVAQAEDWRWSSVRAHINGADDGLVTVRPVLDRIPHFAEWLSNAADQDFGDLRLAEGSGRPLGTPDFVIGLERLLGRTIARRAPGRKPAASVTGEQLKLLQ